MASGPDQPDFLDLLPDPLLLLILNRVSDIKTLLRCRSVSRRLSALVPHSDSLLLRVDRVIPLPPTTPPPSSPPSSALSSPPSTTSYPRTPPSPTPPLESSAASKPLKPSASSSPPATSARRRAPPSDGWRASAGPSRAASSSPSAAAAASRCGLSGRSALIAASARHHMAADVVDEQRLLSHLTVCDRENEGAMIMDKDGLREFRKRTGNGGGAWWRNSRTTVPAVKMRMRHEPRLELSSGVVMEGATLVVVKPVGDGDGERQCEAEETYGHEALAAEAFGNGVNAEAVEKLLKSRTYILEMNSF